MFPLPNLRTRRKSRSGSSMGVWRHPVANESFPRTNRIALDIISIPQMVANLAFNDSICMHQESLT